jgi:hypothetical protein
MFDEKVSQTYKETVVTRHATYFNIKDLCIFLLSVIHDS